MQTKLIQIKDYLLLIDEEAEIKEGNYRVHIYEKTLNHPVHRLEHGENTFDTWKLVLAYYPLTKEAKELDLLLLPPFEGSFNITKWAKEEHKYNHRNIDELSFILGCEVGYEKSQSKQFSLEDMIKAYDEGCSEKFKRTGEAVLREEFIQSLSTQQLPKEFIPNYGTPFVMNSEGKQELVGTYKY